jgi:hypothetical protein
MQEISKCFKAQDGLVGKMSFAANGEIDFPLVVKRIEHGKPRVLSNMAD